MRSQGTSRPGPKGTNQNLATEQLCTLSMASRGPLTRGDGDSSSSLNEQATRNHSRPGWMPKTSTDGTQV